MAAGVWPPVPAGLFCGPAGQFTWPRVLFPLWCPVAAVSTLLDSPFWRPFCTAQCCCPLALLACHASSSWPAHHYFLTYLAHLPLFSVPFSSPTSLCFDRKLPLRSLPVTSTHSHSHAHTHTHKHHTHKHPRHVLHTRSIPPSHHHGGRRGESF